MVRLLDADTGEPIGFIEPDHVDFLIDHLEEEDAADTDYYLTPDTLLYLEEGGAGEELISLLRTAMGDRQEMTIILEQIG